MKKLLILLLLVTFIAGSYNSALAKPDYETRRELTKEEDDKVWEELIPNLGTGSETEMKDAREELVEMGYPVVKHLVYTFNVGNLLRKLESKDKLMLLQQDIIDDIRTWYQKVYKEHAGGETLGKIKGLIDGGEEIAEEDKPSLTDCRSSKQILDKVREIWNTITFFNRDAKEAGKPELPKLTIFSKLRGNAALAIGEIGDMSAYNEVSEQLLDDSNYVKIKVLESLGLMGTLVSEKVCAQIYPYMFDENLKLRTYAWTALRKLDYRVGVVKLIENFEKIEKDNEDKKITSTEYLKTRKHIVEALEGITMQDFNENLESWKNWMAENAENENPLNLEDTRNVKGFKSEG